MPKAALSWHDRGMGRSDICLYTGPVDRAELEVLRTDRNTPRKLAWRADIVLATADGAGTVAIMRRTGMSKPTVWRWQERYLDEGVPGLKRDKTRPSRVPPLRREIRLKMITKTVRETPPNATHWSRAKEFLSFLRRIDRAVKKPRDIHLVLDNYAAHKTPEVQAWLEKHPHFKLRFTPTSASWLNLVERFFAEITTKRIRRSSYTGVDDLEDAIYDYLLLQNAKPKPFVWSKTAEDILTRERRALDALDQIRGNR